MDSLKIKLFFDRKGVANTSNKQGVIELYIYDTISRKKIYISTGIEVTTKQFKQDKGERGYIVQHPNKLHDLKVICLLLNIYLNIFV